MAVAGSQAAAAAAAAAAAVLSIRRTSLLARPVLSSKPPAGVSAAFVEAERWRGADEPGQGAAGLRLPGGGLEGGAGCLQCGRSPLAPKLKAGVGLSYACHGSSGWDRLASYRLLDAPFGPGGPAKSRAER